MMPCMATEPIDPILLEKLLSLGIDPDHAQWVKTNPVNAADLDAVKEQRALLEKIKDTLKVQLTEDLVSLDLAQEELKRLKNGGGV